MQLHRSGAGASMLLTQLGSKIEETFKTAVNFQTTPLRAVPPCVRRSRAEAEAAAPRPGGGGERC